MKNTLAEKRCPVCTNKIYPEGAIVISNGDSDVAFHRTCVKCVECQRAFDGLSRNTKKWFLCWLDFSFFFCLMHRSCHNRKVEI